MTIIMVSGHSPDLLLTVLVGLCPTTTMTRTVPRTGAVTGATGAHDDDMTWCGADDAVDDMLRLLR